MAMSIGSGGSADPEPINDINTTPLIDVMLVLLIMLIITIPVQLHSVNLNLPVSRPSATPPAPPVVVTIDVDASGTVFWNGEALTSHQALDARLQQAATSPEQPQVHLRPNKEAGYETVANVLASAQRHGVTKLGIVGNEQFVD